MKLPVYIQGLRASHYVCVVKSESGEVVAVLSVPKVRSNYNDARSVFREAIRQMRDPAEPAPFSASYYR